MMSALTKTDWNKEWVKVIGGSRTPDTAELWNNKAARCKRAAVPLAAGGHRVCAVDFSQKMLAMLFRESHRAKGLTLRLYSLGQTGMTAPAGASRRCHVRELPSPF
jgi:hypothetical protein